MPTSPTRVREQVAAYYTSGPWNRHFFSLVHGPPSFRFDLHRVGEVHYQRDNPDVPEHIWLDEASRERLLHEIDSQSEEYEELAAASPLLARGGAFRGYDGLLANVIATAANFSALIPLETILESFERLALVRDEGVSPAHLLETADTKFTAVVLQHVLTVSPIERVTPLLRMWTRGGPEGLNAVTDSVQEYLLDLVPLSFDMYRHDFLDFFPPGRPESVRKDDRLRLDNLVFRETLQRRRTVRSWSPPRVDSVIAGACQPFRASLLDAHLVKFDYHHHEPPPSHSVQRPPPGYDHNTRDPFLVNARSPRSRSPRLAEEHRPTFPPPEYH
ncbi:hypothetical protein JCM8547_002506 [Rhodosporidiobolus lusitaniae]